MKVSIIIAFHKGCAFLEDALQSLRDQTYKEFEVILICDHVEEDLERLFDEYQAELGLKVYHLSEKTGVAAARNYGLSVAEGEYIYFLDSDDYLDADTLEILVNAADQEKADLVYGKNTITWFQRGTFLNSQKYNEKEDSEGDTDNDTGDVEVKADDIFENVIEPQMNVEVPEIDSEKETEDSRKKAYKQLLTGKKSLRTITVLNILMKKSVIDEQHIRFNENIVYLSDYPFLFQVLHYSSSFQYEKSALYRKRKHNDPINFPSLSQTYGGKDFMEFINTYRHTINLLEMNPELREILERKLLKYYASGFARRLHRASDTTEIDKRFYELHLLVKDMDDKVFRKYRRYRRRLFGALKAGDVKKSRVIVKAHLAWIKLKKIIRSKRELSKALYIHIFMKQSLKENWVLCESFFGKSYSDNPKYIYEYLSKNYFGRYRFIWVMNKNTKIPYKHTRVKRFSLMYFYYLARCRYYIFNGRQPVWARKREGNTFLQTWHGTPLKRLAFDMEDISSATASYKKQVYQQSKAWDYLIAPNQFSSDIFRQCFLYNKEMLETGYPRNDILHMDGKEQFAERIKAKLGLPPDKKVILYAPTWRDDEYYGKGRYKFSLKLELSLLEEGLSRDYIILLRTHYFIADHLDIDGLEGFVYNVSKYDDIAELYLISDLLITDYSSVFFDYANLRRPMLFFMYDLDKYRDVLRGFYIDIEEELPGPILSTTEEVMESIREIELIKQMYHEKYTRFYDKYCAWEKGNASEIVAKQVFQLQENEEL